MFVATGIGPEVVEIDVPNNAIVATATIGDHGLINANQVMAFDANFLWLPILDDGTVLRLLPPADVVE